MLYWNCVCNELTPSYMRLHSCCHYVLCFTNSELFTKFYFDKAWMIYEQIIFIIPKVKALFMYKKEQSKMFMFFKLFLLKNYLETYIFMQWLIKGDDLKYSCLICEMHHTIYANHMLIKIQFAKLKKSTITYKYLKPMEIQVLHLSEITWWRMAQF